MCVCLFVSTHKRVYVSERYREIPIEGREERVKKEKEKKKKRGEGRKKKQRKK